MIKNSIIYLLSSSLNKALPIFFLPIITRYIDPSNFGKLSIFLVIVTFYNAIIGMNVQINISKNYFIVPKSELSRIIGSSVILVFITAVIFLIITILFSKTIMFYSGVNTKWIFSIPLIVFFMVFNVLNLTLMINERKAIKHAFFEITQAFLYMGLTFMFLVVFDWDWHSQVFGMIVSYLVLFLLGWRYMSMNNLIDLSVSRRDVVSIYKTSVPLVPHVLGGAILTLSDRVFLRNMEDLKVVGVYTVGYTFGMVVLLFTNSFIKAWSPWFYKQLNNPTEVAKIKIVKYTYFYVLGIILLAFMIGLFGRFILPFFVDKRYEGASIFIVWVSLGYAMFGIYQIFFPYLIVMNKTSYLGFSTSIATISNLILNYYLIGYYGAIGAAYATFVSYFIMCIFVFVYTQKHYPMPWLSFTFKK